MNIGEMQRKLSLWAEQDKGRQFHGLFDLICGANWLRLAHDYVAQNAGSVTGGCDGLVMEAFDERLEDNLDNLRQTLRSGEFVARPVRRVYIPKANGKVRPLGIPSIRDRVVQEAVRMVLEPIYEADFSQDSFGFRPNRCTMDAVKRLHLSTQEGKKYFWAVEGDIASYFDTICHRKLMKLLRRRIDDPKLLDLIWAFLRSGVMERKLFKDTKLGTPQGGIISPLLANVYLHELDRYMERYTLLPQSEKTRRRKQGLSNFSYARYADDFVVLCNGSREQAEQMKRELTEFLRSELRLTLSTEKTKVTHLNDGFDFLGFTFRRSVGKKGVVTKVLISAKSVRKHLETIRAATAKGTHRDSFVAKVIALNRIITGWCNYFHYTSRANTQFKKVSYRTYWRMAHWLARKHRLSMPETLQRFRVENTLGTKELRLRLHEEFKTQRYMKLFRKPNPYTTQEAITREDLPAEARWLGCEKRPGWLDLRKQVFQRDGGCCRLCHEPVTEGQYQVDHVRPVCCFRRPVDANMLGNLWLLCKSCHAQKTEFDRQRESRMR